MGTAALHLAQKTEITNPKAEIILGLKVGGNAGAALLAEPDKGVEVLSQANTFEVLGETRNKLEELSRVAQGRGEDRLKVHLVGSIATPVSQDGSKITITDGLARNLIQLGIGEIRPASSNDDRNKVPVKAGLEIRLDEIFNSYLRSKHLPEIKIVSSIVRNDTEMNGIAATHLRPDSYKNEILITASTSGNVVEPGKPNLEVGQASATVVTEAATGMPYGDFFKFMDGAIRTKFTTPITSPLTQDQEGGNKNPLKLIIGSGEGNSAMKLSDFDTEIYKMRTGSFRGIQVHAIAAIDAVDKGGEAARVVLQGLNLQESDVKNSPVTRLAKGVGLKNEEVTDLAERGDNFAKALTVYQAVRMAHAVVGTHKLLHGKDKAAPETVLAQGSYIKHIFFKKGREDLGETEALKAFKNTYRELTGQIPKVELFNPEHDGVASVMEKFMST